MTMFLLPFVVSKLFAGTVIITAVCTCISTATEYTATIIEHPRQQWDDKHVGNFKHTVEVICGYKQNRKRFSCQTYIPGVICEEIYSNVSNLITIHNTTQGLTRMTFSNIILCTAQVYWYFWTSGTIHTNTAKSLDLSGIGITYLPEGIFKHFTSLESLDLSNNNIARYDANFPLGMKEIILLDMSNNWLTEVDLNWTNSVPSLRHLSLGSNVINSVSFDTALQFNLTHLDLAFNRISCIDNSLQNLLKNNITIYLDGNPFTCECMKSLQNRTYDNCTCDNNTQATSEETNKQDFNSIFAKPSLQFITLVLFVILSFGVGLALYIMYKYQVQRSCCRCMYPRDLIDYVVKSPDEHMFDYHAYIVCDENDTEILNKILYQLQTNRNMKLVCDARDAPPNVLHITFIQKCLSTSKRTIFVLSSNFLDNKLCLYVLEMAASLEFLEQICVIIILKLKPLTKEQEELIQKLTLGKMCYDYPDEQEGDASFWDSLAEAINDPKLQFKILGIKQTRDMRV